VASAAELPAAPLRFAAAATGAILVWFGTGLEPLWPLLWFAPLPLLIVALYSSALGTVLLSGCAWLLGSLNMWHYLHGVIHAPYLVLAAIFMEPALVFAGAVFLFRTLALTVCCKVSPMKQTPASSSV
jgi:apolipoprotein N-acyltransferase